MDGFNFSLLIAFCLILFSAGVTVVLVLVRKQNQQKSLISAFSVRNINKNKAKISRNLLYLKQANQKVSKSKSDRNSLKQNLRWDLLMLTICTTCFDRSYTFYTNTWLFNEFELKQLKKLGFTVRNKSFWGQLPARCVTAVSFWLLHKDLKGAFKFFGNKRRFYKITWTPETANRLKKFITNYE